MQQCRPGELSLYPVLTGRFASGRQRRLQQVERSLIVAERSGLPRRGDEARTDDSTRVDHEGRPISETFLLEEHAVLLGDSAVGPEIGQQAEAVCLLLPEGTQGMAGIDRDCEELDSAIGEQADVIAQGAELTAADSGECEGEEDQGYGFLPPKLAELDPLSELVEQFKIGGLGIVF